LQEYQKAGNHFIKGKRFKPILFQKRVLLAAFGDLGGKLLSQRKRHGFGYWGSPSFLSPRCAARSMMFWAARQSIRYSLLVSFIPSHSCITWMANDSNAMVQHERSVARSRTHHLCAVVRTLDHRHTHLGIKLHRVQVTPRLSYVALIGQHQYALSPRGSGFDTNLQFNLPADNVKPHIIVPSLARSTPAYCGKIPGPSSLNYSESFFHSA
jgi:hypothetical protein